MKFIKQGRIYLLNWRNNPEYWNDDLERLKRAGIVTRINKRYYTRVEAHFTGRFESVDCTCNLITGDFYPIHTSLLKEAEHE